MADCCQFAGAMENTPCGPGICTPNMPEVHHHHGENAWDELITMHGPAPAVCPDCGRPEGTFACKIRHIQVNTGWAKSAND